MSRNLDVVGIGNALVDILTHVEEDFLVCHGIKKGIMQLVNLDRAAELYDLIEHADRACGGSAANTVASLAGMGMRTAFIGKTKEDDLGRVFTADFARLNAICLTQPAPASVGFETGRCTILVTPDGERSMNTYLGAAEHLGPDDIDEAMIENSAWVYLEGYRFDGAEGQEAFRKAVRCCRRAGVKSALTLSDPFCVFRHRAGFLDLIEEGIDLLFCNHAELLAMAQTDDLDLALNETSDLVDIVACTLAQDGAIVTRGNQRMSVPAYDVPLVDATGAGDLFAAGFLFGLIRDLDLTRCAELGCAAAAEIVSQMSARCDADLMTRFRAYGLI